MTTDTFKCLICNSFPLETSEICELKCKHVYCWKCIENYLCCNLKAKIKCPNNDCQCLINDAFIRKILPEVKIKDYENLCIPKNCDQIFHCLLPECNNAVCFLSKSVQYECQMCSLFNCIECKAAHPFMSCINYQKKKSAINDKKSQQELKTMELDEMTRARSVLSQIKRREWEEDYRSLDQKELVPNHGAFECSICSKIVPKEQGVQLRKCFHVYCRSCLHDSVKNCENIPIICPGDGCQGKLEDREIRAILSADECRIYDLKCHEMAKAKIENIFHCKKPDCQFYGIVDYSQYNNFECPVCKNNNCLKCSTIHQKGETCDQYQDKLNEGKSADFRSLAYIENEIKTGKCMKCTACGSLIRKDGGCNWIKCPHCKLEICWVLKIPRWGPKGTGDISGGCRCGVNNIPCSPKCLLGCIPEH